MWLVFGICVAVASCTNVALLVATEGQCTTPRRIRVSKLRWYGRDGVHDRVLHRAGARLRARVSTRLRARVSRVRLHEGVCAVSAWVSECARTRSPCLRPVDQRAHVLGLHFRFLLAAAHVGLSLFTRAGLDVPVVGVCDKTEPAAPVQGTSFGC